jgi:peptide/nickel transport system permease protein
VNVQLTSPPGEAIRRPDRRRYFTLATRALGRVALVSGGVMVLAFSLLRLSPGDPVYQILGITATPERVAALREELGLNGSLLDQFATYSSQRTLQTWPQAISARPSRTV